MQLASRFIYRSPVLRSAQPLSNDQIRAVAPSIFAEAKHDSRSARYSYIPTAAVLTKLRREGFHPASAGHGLNLQDGGNILAFFSVNWNLEEHQQIIERIGPTRQMQAGHDRPVFIYYILARDTVDELVRARLETKREVQDLLLEAMKKRS